MVIGILAILATAFLSALTFAIPLFIIFIGIELFSGMTSRLKARNIRLENWLYVITTPLATYTGAVAQLAIWQLESGRDAMRWAIVGGVYMVGTFVAMFFVAMKVQTPYLRSAWVNMYALSALIMFALLAACFHSPETYTFLERSPAKASKFVFGESAK
jgi:hypothetical protein